MQHEAVAVGGGDDRSVEVGTPKGATLLAVARDGLGMGEVEGVVVPGRTDRDLRMHRLDKRRAARSEAPVMGDLEHRSGKHALLRCQRALHVDMDVPGEELTDAAIAAGEDQGTVVDLGV